MRAFLVAAIGGAILGLWGGASAGAAGDVKLDGSPIPRATSTLSVRVDVTEYRDGTEVCPRLLPGCPKAAVCIGAPAPIAPLDAQLAGAPAVKFIVAIEDGRQLGGCVPSSLDTTAAGNRQRYSYCLRCESLTAP